jgi:hypothetical protein
MLAYVTQKTNRTVWIDRYPVPCPNAVVVLHFESIGVVVRIEQKKASPCHALQAIDPVSVQSDIKGVRISSFTGAPLLVGAVHLVSESPRLKRVIGGGRSAQSKKKFIPEVFLKVPAASKI